MDERDQTEEEPMANPGTSGVSPAKATPRIGDDDVTEGQTQAPAADDDVGVPSEEELNRES